MEAFVRKNPLFALCGLNCCLCPRFNTDGVSKCPGCGGAGFADKHPTCAVATCNRKHDNVEYCFQCAEYPCKKYQEDSTRDSFISYKSVKRNFAEAKSDLGRYEDDLQKRYEILRKLLSGYNDGKSKGLYCLVANDMPLNELEELLHVAETLPQDMSVKEKAEKIKDKIESSAKKMGVAYKLRK